MKITPEYLDMNKICNDYYSYYWHVGAFNVSTSI